MTGSRTCTPLVGIDDIIDRPEGGEGTGLLSDKIVGYIFAIVAATRNHPFILTGISTRGGINLAEAAKAHAFLEGRDFVIPEDVKAVALPVGAHRLILRPEHEALDKEDLFQAVLKNIDIPMV